MPTAYVGVIHTFNIHRYLETVYPEQTLPDKNGRGGFPKGAVPNYSRKNSKILNKGWVSCNVSDSTQRGKLIFIDSAAIPA